VVKIREHTASSGEANTKIQLSITTNRDKKKDNVPKKKSTWHRGLAWQRSHSIPGSKMLHIPTKRESLDVGTKVCVRQNRKAKFRLAKRRKRHPFAHRVEDVIQHVFPRTRATQSGHDPDPAAVLEEELRTREKMGGGKFALTVWALPGRVF
jgi:hypothetical protein